MPSNTLHWSDRQPPWQSHYTGFLPGTPFCLWNTSFFSVNQNFSSLKLTEYKLASQINSPPPDKKKCILLIIHPPPSHYFRYFFVIFPKNCFFLKVKIGQNIFPWWSITSYHSRKLVFLAKVKAARNLSKCPILGPESNLGPDLDLGPRSRLTVSRSKKSPRMNMIRGSRRQIHHRSLHHLPADGEIQVPADQTLARHDEAETRLYLSLKAVVLAGGRDRNPHRLFRHPAVE